MKSRVSAVLAILITVVLLVPLQAGAAKGTSKVNDSIEVLEQIMAIPEKGIPPALLKNAQGIAIIPGVIKAGFIIGGRHGTGIVVVREEGGWSNPAFISITGGSVGWQIGAESTDIILVFKSRKGVDSMLKSKFTLGADAAVAAGPVGRQASAATDVQLKAEIYSYSRSRGLFAGISLEGASLQIDDEADVAFYNKDAIRANDIFTDKALKAPPVVKKLKEVLGKYTK
ncbi:MAG TPA: lipid-binding SYLF domain-containing protein [Thermodesulfovibrionales bacterium]|nr:lipid-binding SYLF domain-containing protein [Thermodesulfovibrionales bacterium]